MFELWQACSAFMFVYEDRRVSNIIGWEEGKQTLTYCGGTPYIPKVCMLPEFFATKWAC
jgi:hypothetical protein